MIDVEQFRERVLALGFDVVHGSEAGGITFLVAGKERRSEGEWFENGRPVDFVYKDGTAIASGRTTEELDASLAEYERINKMSWLEYIQDYRGRPGFHPPQSPSEAREACWCGGYRKPCEFHEGYESGWEDGVLYGAEQATKGGAHAVQD